MRNINEWIKDLETKFDGWRSLQSSFDHLFNRTDQDEPDEYGDHNADREFEEIEEKYKEEKREERRDTSQASGYKSASSYTYKASYASPDREENNLNSYLTNWNIAASSSRTDNNSLEGSKGRESRESILRHQYASFKHHASTSRINTYPKFNSERKEVVVSEESNVVHEKDNSMFDQNRSSLARLVHQ